MNLYRYNDVYFPENSYYNSDSLPQEWIEVIEEAQGFITPLEIPIRLFDAKDKKKDKEMDQI